MVNTVQQQPPPPKISLLPNLWVIIPIVAVVVAIISANLLLLNYIHVFTAILWTGTDIFMAFLLGPVLRNVSLATRKEVISWLMPKMVFFMPTVAAVTTTAGYFLASKMGLITLSPPVVYWISAVLVIVSIMFIQGLGILLPTNLRIYFEMRKNEPDMSRIQRLMRRLSEFAFFRFMSLSRLNLEEQQHKDEIVSFTEQVLDAKGIECDSKIAKISEEQLREILEQVRKLRKKRKTEVDNERQEEELDISVQ